MGGWEGKGSSSSLRKWITRVVMHGHLPQPACFQIRLLDRAAVTILSAGHVRFEALLLSRAI